MHQDLVSLNGCDISAVHLKDAERLHQGPNYVLAPRALKGPLPFKSKSMDIITCSFVVSCIEDHDELMAYLKELKRVLKNENGVLMVMINNPAEIVDTRFVGLQISSDSKVDPKPMDKVRIKFYESSAAKEPYWSSLEVWRPTSTEMMMELLQEIFPKRNVLFENLKHEQAFDIHVERLSMDPALLKHERVKSPFTLFVVESNGILTESKRKRDCLLCGYIRVSCPALLLVPKLASFLFVFL